jgi:hypothetical protein
MALQPFVGPWPLLQFRNLSYTDGRTPRTSDQPVARPLPTRRTTQTQNKRTQTSMTRTGFEPTIPPFERGKSVHALDRAATMLGQTASKLSKFQRTLLGISYTGFSSTSFPSFRYSYELFSLDTAWTLN